MGKYIDFHNTLSVIVAKEALDGSKKKLADMLRNKASYVNKLMAGLDASMSTEEGKRRAARIRAEKEFVDAVIDFVTMTDTVIGAYDIDAAKLQEKISFLSMMSEYHEMDNKMMGDILKEKMEKRKLAGNGQTEAPRV